jgi:putative membrane protein
MWIALKNVCSVYLIAIAAYSVLSCTEGKVKDTKAVAEEHNEAKFDSSKEKDATFLSDAAEINLEEIELGKLAQKNAMVPDIQNLGKSIRTEHNKVFESLKILAVKKMISVPDSLTQKGKDSYRNLMAQPGKDFDRAFCGLMVENHKKAIALYELASNDCTDEDLKAWAIASLPTLRHQLDNAMICQKKLDTK